MDFLCNIMDINRSGYYKWRSRKETPNRYEKDRILLTELLQDAHKAHPSHGYHRLARDVFYQTGWIFSDNLAHKCCKNAGIHSRARKGSYSKDKFSALTPTEKCDILFNNVLSKSEIDKIVTRRTDQRITEMEAHAEPLSKEEKEQVAKDIRNELADAIATYNEKKYYEIFTSEKFEVFL